MRFPNITRSAAPREGKGIRGFFSGGRAYLCFVLLAGAVFAAQALAASHHTHKPSKSASKSKSAPAGPARQHATRKPVRCKKQEPKHHKRSKQCRKKPKAKPVAVPPAQPVAPGSVSPASAAPSPTSEPLRLFSAQSVFNQPLPASAELASNSAHLVNSFENQLRKYGHAVINTTEWSAPVYVVGAQVAPVALAGSSSICPRPEGVYSGFQAQINAVPLPANMVPAAGGDKEVIIYQPATGHLWELWRVVKESGQWSACWGAEITNASESDGIVPAPFGAGASGLSLLGGQIHLEDLERGSINHALEVLLPDTANSLFVWPADRTDGTSTAEDAIPEGTRFRLNPKLDLGSLHLSPAALEIATAIQRYGLIVGDTAGSVALSAQDPTPLIREGKANPYARLLGDPYNVLDAVPWSELEAVSPNFRG